MQKRANRKTGSDAVANLYDRVERVETAFDVGFVWKAVPFVIVALVVIAVGIEGLARGTDQSSAALSVVVGVLVLTIAMVLWRNEQLRRAVVAMA